MKRSNSRRQPQLKHGSRSGVAVIMAFAAIFVVSAICLAMVKTLVLMDQRIDYRLERAQLDAVAEAAVDRVERKLQQDPQLSSDRWLVTLPESSEQVITEITVEPGPTDDRRLVKVVTRWGDGSHSRDELKIESLIQIRAESQP